MNEPDPNQKKYLDAVARNAERRRCRCGGTAQPVSTHAVMWGAGANALSTSINYRCPSCGHHFRIGLVGDAIGFLIVAAILGRIGMESFWVGLFFVPLALILTVMAINTIRLRLRHPVIKAPHE